MATSFYIMDMVEECIIWDATFPTVSYEHRPRDIASLHNIDYRVVGRSRLLRHVPAIDETCIVHAIFATMFHALNGGTSPYWTGHSRHQDTSR